MRGFEHGGESAVQVPAADEADRWGRLLDTFCIPLAGGLAGYPEAFADHGPGVSGVADLSDDLIDGRVGPAGELAGDGEDGVEQIEGIVTCCVGVGRLDELVRVGLWAYADNRKLSVDG
ncbi:hypothetical protein ABT404_00790 [Streptomyces hyaluromycini]|uniref:Uncharacterized protein n=1 Tax=Streptomyces hyaluromycini TaxID=1377993 RepID=A0ABV1WME3_9ACTN